MKKSIGFLLLIVGILVFYVGCKRDEGDATPPTINITLLSEAEYGEVGDTIKYKIVVSDDVLVKSLGIRPSINGANEDSRFYELLEIKENEREYFYVVPGDKEIGSTILISFEALDASHNRTIVERIINTKPVMMHYGKLEQDEVWSSEFIHVVQHRIDIFGATLTIEHGTEIRFNEGLSLVLREEASIVAKGLNDKPILFTANSNEPHPGFWGGIEIDGSNKNVISNFEYCKFEYCGREGESSGSGAIWLWIANVSIDNCTITDVLGYGVQNWYSDFISFKNNRIENTSYNPLLICANNINSIGEGNIFTVTNPNDGIEILYNTHVERNVIMKKQTVPYLVNGRMKISGSLSIEPGVQILMQNSYYNGQFIVEGSINANGVEEDKISFELSGDETDNNWGGILLKNNYLQSMLNYCDISNGGLDHANIKLSNTGSNVSISNCNIANSAGYGIYIDQNSTPTLTNNIFSGNVLDDIFYQ